MGEPIVQIRDLTKVYGPGDVDVSPLTAKVDFLGD
jgi:hypothetical protein